MERYLKTARAHRALAVLYGLLTLLLLVLSVVLFVDSSDDELAPGAVFLVLLLLGALFSMHFFTARAAFQRKNGGLALNTPAMSGQLRGSGSAPSLRRASFSGELLACRFKHHAQLAKPILVNERLRLAYPSCLHGVAYAITAVERRHLKLALRG